MKNAFQIHHKTIICVVAFIFLAIVVITFFETDTFPTDIIENLTDMFQVKMANAI